MYMYHISKFQMFHNTGDGLKGNGFLFPKNMMEAATIYDDAKFNIV